jgi:hypothetical protein
MISKEKIVTVNVDPKVKRELEARAVKEKRTLSNLVALILEQHVEQAAAGAR